MPVQPCIRTHVCDVHARHLDGHSGPYRYLVHPPETIAIDGGRQLFVDGFLIDPSLTSGVEITYHNATYRDDVNPVLVPDKVTVALPSLSCVCHDHRPPSDRA